MLIRRWKATVVAVAMMVGFLLGMAGCGNATVGKTEADKAKAFAVEYYQADALAHDPARAWEMMNEVKRKGHGNFDKFAQLVNMTKPVPLPKALQVQEWREPQQRAYTYLFKASEVKPWVIVVVTDDAGALSVLDAYLYKGEQLP